VRICDGLDVHEKRVGGSMPDGAVQVATYVSGAPAYLAVLEARLVVHNGCLVAGDPDGKRFQLLVFPAADVSWDGQTLTCRGVGYRSGDFIQASGGVMDVARLRGFRVPEAWAATKTAFVIAPSS
jgi:hypothetical protein